MTTSADSTPDFYTYGARPIGEAEIDGELVLIRWPDGAELRAHALWLWENRMAVDAIDEQTREGTIDPVDLPPASVLRRVAVDSGGDLIVHWDRAAASTHHSGWLRHVADGRHRPASGIPAPEHWRATDRNAPPTFDGVAVLNDHEALREWLDTLCRLGIARLEGLPVTKDVLARIGDRIGAMRDTNFGVTWPVSVDMAPTSTANTVLALAPHTDLPTRETPPGFQLLHCLVNSCGGGLSHMTDGYAVATHLAEHEPAAYDALTSLHWVFFNRSPAHDHRWSAPIIDHGSAGQPLTLRAFHPVRAFPDMADADIPRAYEALRIFGEVAGRDDFQMRYAWRPGDLVAFDNRRILHGRGLIDSDSGVRELHGTYIDHDEVYSRLRVLNRRKGKP